jgi:hypothetical protein
MRLPPVYKRFIGEIFMPASGEPSRPGHIYHENAKKSFSLGNRVKQGLLFYEFCMGDYTLIILSPGVFTLGAAEEPDLAFISSPELAEPPDRKIVLTLGALDLDGGHSLHSFSLVIHYHDLLLLAL